MIAVPAFVLLLAATGLAAFPVGLAAQERHQEIGVDATFASFGQEGDAGVRVVEAPRWLRFGLPVGDHLLVETALAWRRVSSGGSASSALEVRPSLSWLWGDEGATRPYVGVVLDYTRLGGAAVVATQVGLGLAGGIRVPVAEFVVLRLEAGYEHAFEGSGVESGNRSHLAVGVSVGVPARD